MIDGKWKLIVPDPHNRPKDKVELYDLIADPYEEHNLAASHERNCQFDARCLKWVVARSVREHK